MSPAAVVELLLLVAEAFGLPSKKLLSFACQHCAPLKAVHMPELAMKGARAKAIKMTKPD